MSRNVRLDAHSGAESLMTTKEYCPTSFPLSLPFGHSVLTTSAASHVTHLSGGRHLLPSAVSLRTVRATFTAYGSSLHKGIV
ncbi:hypothetical protein ACED23_24610 [Vibrio splendidus]|uniref:hypothetical protein n=1 Tax=Vibrio splendidus TaxID=29497 RepID=UPI00352E8BC1